MTQRFHALDSLRASMMLLGIYLHVSCAYSNLPDVWWYRDSQRSELFDVTLLYIHLFRMPVFMVMAGFFSALLVGKRGVAGFLRNRAVRIGVPLVLGALTLYPLMWSMSRYGRAIGQPNALGLMWQTLLSGRWAKYMDTTHLWFLNYLLWLYALTAIARWLARPIADRVVRQFGIVLDSPTEILLFPLLTFCTLSFMEFGMLDTKNGWIPVPRVVAAYWVFYGFGWLLFHYRDRLSGWTRGAWTKVALTVPLTLINLICMQRQLEVRGHRDWLAFFGAVTTGSIVVWLMIFGLTGLFIRYFGSESARWRYLSDSAYWQYVLHSPVVLAWQLVFAPIALSSYMKCLLVTALSAVVLLLTYDWFARSTWVGVLLNGRRYPRALTFSRATPPREPAPARSGDLDPAM